MAEGKGWMEHGLGCMVFLIFVLVGMMSLLIF